MSEFELTDEQSSRVTRLVKNGWVFSLVHDGTGWKAAFYNSTGGERYESTYHLAPSEAVWEVLYALRGRVDAFEVRRPPYVDDDGTKHDMKRGPCLCGTWH
jgi:hypothetical protein